MSLTLNVLLLLLQVCRLQGKPADALTVYEVRAHRLWRVHANNVGDTQVSPPEGAKRSSRTSILRSFNRDNVHNAGLKSYRQSICVILVISPLQSTGPL